MWRHTIRAEDGTHHHLYPTEDKALDAMAKNAGFDRASCGSGGRERVDDWGRTHYVQECPRGVTTVSAMETLERAFDKRECGEILSSREATILQESGW